MLTGNKIMEFCSTTLYSATERLLCLCGAFGSVEIKVYGKALTSPRKVARL